MCGADADIIVARNLGRTIAAGAAAHSDHGRDILEVFGELAEGATSGYELRDKVKLEALAEEWGIEVEGRDSQEIALELADAMMEDFGSRKTCLGFSDRLPHERRRPAVRRARLPGRTAGPDRAGRRPAQREPRFERAVGAARQPAARREPAV